MYSTGVNIVEMNCVLVEHHAMEIRPCLGPPAGRIRLTMRLTGCIPCRKLQSPVMASLDGNLIVAPVVDCVFCFVSSDVEFRLDS